MTRFEMVQPTGTQDVRFRNFCPNCGCDKMNFVDYETVCTRCGMVMHDESQWEGGEVCVSKLNLYQAAEAGTKKVNLECARHIHETCSDVSILSNICVKLELPIYVAHDINAVYHKILRYRKKEQEKDGKNGLQCSKLGRMKTHVSRGMAKGCTKAHIAVFAVHLVCRKYGLPRTGTEILDAVGMNFGVKRRFTILKAYSVNRIIAQEAGISCNCNSEKYYLRLLLSRLQNTIGPGPVYDRIERIAVVNLQKISGARSNERAYRAVELAIKGARLNVQV